METSWFCWCSLWSLHFLTSVEISHPASLLCPVLLKTPDRKRQPFPVALRQVSSKLLWPWDSKDSPEIQRQNMLIGWVWIESLVYVDLSLGWELEKHIIVGNYLSACWAQVSIQRLRITWLCHCPSTLCLVGSHHSAYVNWKCFQWSGKPIKR